MSASFQIRRKGIFVFITAAVLLCGHARTATALDRALQFVERWQSGIRGINECVAIRGNYAYVALGQTGLGIFDISNPTNPLPMGTAATIEDATGVAVEGDYAYVADGTAGLQVIDISDPANPARIGGCIVAGTAFNVLIKGHYAIMTALNKLQFLDISNPTNPVSVAEMSTSNARGMSLRGDILYVADGAGSFRVIDVSDPSAPLLIDQPTIYGNVLDVAIIDNWAYFAGNFGLSLWKLDTIDNKPISYGTIAVGGSPQEIKAYNGDLYVATEEGGLKIFAVANGTNVTLTGTVSANDLQGDYVYSVTLASSKAYSLGYAGIYITDVTTPSAPSQLGKIDTSGAAFGVVISNGYAFVADEYAGLQILDIRNPHRPVRVGHFESTSRSMQNLALVGNLAFVACTDLGGLLILDVSDVTNPVLVGTYPDAEFTDVQVVGNYAYLAEPDYGLYIVDVSNPADPSYVSRLLPSQSTEGSGVIVRGQYAYLSGGPAGIFVMGVSNPASPQKLGSYNTDGYASHITLSGNYAFVSDHSGGLYVLNIANANSPQFVTRYSPALFWPVHSALSSNYLYCADQLGGLTVLDVSNPAAPQHVTDIRMKDAAQGVAVDKPYAYVANNVDGLAIYELNSLANPQRINRADTPGYASGVTVVSNYAYVADQSTGLQIFNVSNPTNVQLVGSIDTTGLARRVAVAGNYAYVADEAGGFRIINIANPASPQHVGGYSTPGIVRDIAVAGNHAYVTAGTNLLAIAVNNPSNPPLVGVANISIYGQLYGVELNGHYAYVANAFDGLMIIDVSDPGNMQIAASYKPQAIFLDVTVMGNYAYVAADANGLYVLDVSNPAAPRLVSKKRIGGNAVSVTVTGNLAYLATGDAGLKVLDVSDPGNPQWLTGNATFDAQDIYVASNRLFVAAGNDGLITLYPYVPLRRPPLSITGAKKTPGGTLVDVEAVPGAQVSIERSANLQTWQFWTNAFQSLSPLQFTDSQTNSPRFYRATIP